MPRAKSILQSEFPYHVTARCWNKEWFSLPLHEVWDIFSEQLTFMRWGFQAEILAFVLMNNHFHLLIRTPQSNLDKIMAFFMRETTRSINKRIGRINQAFGGPHFRCVIESHHYYMHAYKYVYLNPVKGGLVSRCEDYSFSSLNFLLGGSKASFPMHFDDTLFSDIPGTLNWLNRSVDDKAWDYVHNAMHRKHFKLAKVNYSRNENPLEKLLL